MSPATRFHEINDRLSEITHEQADWSMSSARFYELEAERYELLREKAEVGNRMYAAMAESAAKIAAHIAENGELGLADYVNAM